MNLKNGTMNRRTAVVAGAAALAAGVAIPREASAQGRPMFQRGVTGGGLATLDGGEAEFSILASKIRIGSEDAPPFCVGSFRWAETGSGLAFESTEIIDCRGLPGFEQANTVTGRIQLNGEGDYPFLIETVDAGGPGAKKDTITLYVGAAVPDLTGLEDIPTTRFSYVAEGELEIGDLQFLNIEQDVPIAEQ